MLTGALCRREKEAHATHWPPALAIPQELEDDEVAAPEQFKCPITLAIMTEPALTPNGEDLRTRLACPGCATDHFCPPFHGPGKTMLCEPRWTFLQLTYATAGMTYERPAILKWLETRRHDPCTKAPLRKRHLAPNLALRGVIEGWVLEQCRRRQAL